MEGLRRRTSCSRSTGDKGGLAGAAPMKTLAVLAGWQMKLAPAVMEMQFATDGRDPIRLTASSSVMPRIVPACPSPIVRRTVRLDSLGHWDSP